MKTRILMVAVMALLIAAPATGQAQADKEASLGLANVLRLNGINQEVGLTDMQRDQLFGLWLEIKFDLDRAFTNFNDNFSETLPAPRQDDLKQELKNAIAKVREKENKRLEDTLNEGQLKRLKQLRIQYITRSSDGVSDLGKELDLTPAQVSSIEKAREAAKKELAEIQKSQRVEQLTKVEIIQIVKQLHERTKTEIESHLTTAQRQKLNSIRGEAFDFENGQSANQEQEHGEDAGSAKQTEAKKDKLP